ncbi:MAG: anaerobic ribonucleoside-triphosphate reductase [Treponema sp.]
MRTLEQVNADIEQVKSELANVKGSETEVYARIVGYYRSVRNWNKGKREEFGHRVMFEAETAEAKEDLAV